MLSDMPKFQLGGRGGKTKEEGKFVLVIKLGVR
jgi:hypothetical protein